MFRAALTCFGKSFHKFAAAQLKLWQNVSDLGGQAGIYMSMGSCRASIFCITIPSNETLSKVHHSHSLKENLTLHIK